MSEEKNMVAKKGTETAPTIRQMIEGDTFRAQVAKALPKHLTPDRFIRIAITALTKTPKLAQCSQASLFNSLLNLSQLGIEPDGRRAHLIPYGENCQLIVDYKGLVELALRTGKVSNIHADTVCKNDLFEVNKGEIKTHRVEYREPRGEVYAAYAIVRFKDGTEKAEVMTREEIETIRKRSKAGQSGPWITDWSEMAKKTVFRRLSKWIELSPEQRDLFEIDDDKFSGDGKWVPPEPKKPIMRMFEKPLEEINIEKSTVSEPEPKESLADLLQKIQEEIISAGVSEGKLVSLLRQDEVLKAHEALENLTSEQAKIVLKTMPAYLGRARVVGAK